MSMLSQILVSAIVAVPASAATAQETPGVELATEGDTIHARLVTGENLWTNEIPSLDSLHPVNDRGGTWLVNDRLLIAPDGRLLWRSNNRAISGNAHRGGDDCPSWTELAEITAPPNGSDQIAPPLVDSTGNVWLINTNIQSGDYSLQVRTSEGHTGSWGPLETVSDTTNYVSQPEGAIDGDDNITIVFRDISGGYKLYAIRYEPGSGWGPLTQVYATGTFFQAIEVAADDQGRVIAIFDPDPGANAVSSVVYDPGDGTWGSPVQVSGAGVNTRLPTIEQSADGSAVYLSYVVVGGDTPGLWAHRWDGDAGEWGPAEYLADSDNFYSSFVGPVSRLNMTVGGDGEAAIFWQGIRTVGEDDFFTVYAHRTMDGEWQPRHELLEESEHDTDFENFANAQSNATGDVLGTITRFEGAGANRFWALRYDAVDGWREPANPYSSGSFLSTRVRGTFYQGEREVATLLGSQGGQSQLTSLRSTGVGWLEELIDIPGEYTAFYQELIADGDEAMLVFEAESGGNQGNKASWLRNLAGDLDCDGVITVSDLLELLADWGPCAPPPPDCPADLDGNGSVDVGDLLDLLANWS